MRVLVLNSGSSSIRFQIIETSLEQIAQHTDKEVLVGQVERIGSLALLKYKVFQQGGNIGRTITTPLRTHEDALKYLVKELEPYLGPKSSSQIDAVGHRVVHGGESFKVSQKITPAVLKEIRNCVELAPLHNPANLSGIEACEDVFGKSMPQVAVFDTAFHTDMPEESFLYPIPYQYYRRHKLRRYGFHGTSHRYLAYRYRRFKNLPKENVHIITLHLGNGASACAIKEGCSWQTSMGLTPLEGLMMGTRSGDIDPSLLEYIAQKEGLSLSEIDLLLNKQSGLLGISGITNDMKELKEEIESSGDRRAQLAVDMFCVRVKQYIGRYLTLLPKCQAVIFSGGIGENSASIREQVCENLDHIGLKLNLKKNMEGVFEQNLATEDSRLEIYAVRTNEELLIARDTVRVVS